MCRKDSVFPARGRWRTVVRWGALAAAVVLAWPGRTESSTSVILPALSPFVASCSVLAGRTIVLTALLACPVLLLALWFPRWFCRYGCPAGLLQELLERLRPGKRLAPARVPAAGQYLVALTLGGACLGFPLFLWLDPLALFNAFLNSWQQPWSSARCVAGLGLPLLLLFDFVFPRIWCQRLCPLGATQELLGRPRRWWQDHRTPAAPASVPGGRKIARRLFLGGCAGAAASCFVNRSPATPPLRPPGALAEHSFTGVCLRCGNCVQACPARIIQPDFGASGILGWLTPRLRFEEAYCLEDCHRCGQVCPSGAIARLPLRDKRRRVIGLAWVDLNACLLANGRECTECLRRCPFDALRRHSPDGGFSYEPQVDPAKCNGCGACESACPTRPRRAIRVLPFRTPRQLA